jgi:hemerythrin
LPLSWTSELETGHPEIDDQHREMVRRAAAFIAACEAGGNVADLGRLLDCLDAYVLTHFATEERLMRAASYPRRAAHRIEHDYFETAALKLRMRLEDGAEPELLSLSRDFLVDWLTGHIARSDRDLVAFLRSAALSSAP